MVRILTVKNCSYCDELKTRLSDMQIDFNEVDIDSEKGKKEVENISKIANTDYVPIVIVKNNVLVPTTSFKTMEQASNIIKKLITNT